MKKENKTSLFGPEYRDVGKDFRNSYKKAFELFRRGSPGKKYDVDALRGLAMAGLTTAVFALWNAFYFGGYGLLDTEKNYKKFQENLAFHRARILRKKADASA